MISYLKDADAIHALSLQRIRRYLPASLSGADKALTARLVQACGTMTISEDIRIHPHFIDCARRALQAHCHIFCDSQMVTAGINKKRIATSRIINGIADPDVAAYAKAQQTTRAAALVDIWQQQEPWRHHIIAIGNAPTCLFRLLEHLQDMPEQDWPAAVIAFPVGFVGAATAKDLFHKTIGRTLPHITLLGTRGGSAITVAALHALLDDK